MLSRIVMTTALTGLLAAGATSVAQAQQPTSSGQQAADPSGWTFNIAPYGWFANHQRDQNFNLPPALGGTLSADTSIGFGELLSHLNFATMVAADAQYDRFSLLTDFIYMNVSGMASQFRSVNFPACRPFRSRRTVQTSVGMNLNATIWTLAGGYTLLTGDWGNFDVIAGFRYLGMPVTLRLQPGTYTDRAARQRRDVRAHRQRVRHRQHLEWHRRLSRPHPPWQYRAVHPLLLRHWRRRLESDLADRLRPRLPHRLGRISLTYRYLSFEQGSGAVLEHLSIKGPMIMANFTF